MTADSDDPPEEILMNKSSSLFHEVVEIFAIVMVREGDRRDCGKPMTQENAVKIDALVSSAEERLEVMKPMIAEYRKSMKSQISGDPIKPAEPNGNDLPENPTHDP